MDQQDFGVRVTGGADAGGDAGRRGGGK